ncbi:MAG: Fur family transcriptional regulator [Candidatus Paceibacterota bacterium]|jgi:Fe2+ or Zn2+ uptake regulation protein
MVDKTKTIILKELGLKTTKVRLQILKKLKHPIDAIELTRLLKVNKTSVYRELKQLISKGLVEEIEFGDGKKRYELSSLGHHHHLFCLNCHKVEDVVIDEKLINQSLLVKSPNFMVVKHNLEFFGYCQSCQL